MFELIGFSVVFGFGICLVYIGRAIWDSYGTPRKEQYWGLLSAAIGFAIMGFAYYYGPVSIQIIRG